MTAGIPPKRRRYIWQIKIQASLAKVVNKAGNRSLVSSSKSLERAASKAAAEHKNLDNSKAAKAVSIIDK
jgi:hypothetical protein